MRPNKYLRPKSRFNLSDFGLAHSKPASIPAASESLYLITRTHCCRTAFTSRPAPSAMPAQHMNSAPSVKEQPRGHGMERWHIAVALGATFAAYGLLAYVILPACGTPHGHQPGLAVRAMATQTKQGIPGDPMNVGLVGSRDDVI